MQLHNQFAGFEIPKEVKEMRKIGIKMFNSSKIEKMFYFIKEFNLDFTQIYDQYLHSFPFTRMEGESKEEFINRSRFQKIMGKVKPYFYNYDNYLLIKSNQ